MRFEPNDPPRLFEAGKANPIQIADCGRLGLEPDEQITMVTPDGGEVDVARKAWGFYATPSLNDRLRRFGLHGALVKSPSDRYYVMLVEEGHEQEFEAYLRDEEQTLITWLDSSEALWAVERGLRVEGDHPTLLRVGPCLCGGDRFETWHHYDAPPEGEVRFDFSVSGGYSRDVLRCRDCGHFRSVHEMDDTAMYEGQYVDATYGGGGIQRTFDKINSLPPEQSDNVGRVHCIQQFTAQYFPTTGAGARTLLDVGSGLGVFPYRMKEAGWSCTALDPDARAVEHARTNIGIEAVQADFMRVQDLGRFDLVTFNKVLEHVQNPIEMLAVTQRFVAPDGLVYIELPDGECAAADGPSREEFFIDHHHVFSAASMTLLIARAGLVLLVQERLREPSGKYTLRAFARPQHQPHAFK